MSFEPTMKYPYLPWQADLPKFARLSVLMRRTPGAGFGRAFVFPK